jgi:hypothetical protein
MGQQLFYLFIHFHSREPVKNLYDCADDIKQYEDSEKNKQQKRKSASTNSPVVKKNTQLKTAKSEVPTKQNQNLKKSQISLFNR